MLKRYSTEAMLNIWSEQKKYESWLEVEILTAEAYKNFTKEITQKEIDQIRSKAKVDIKRIKELEAIYKHDVIAFTRQISETLGPEKKWIHYGITSTDVVDTAQSIRLKKANEIIEKELIDFVQVLKEQAIKYKDTYQMGRTHGIHAEVSTFGYKIALWFDEMSRNLERFQNIRPNIEVAKISGAVGNYANIPLNVQEEVAKKLNLTSSKISTQVLQRDRHAEYIFNLSLIATSLDKFATEIRHLQRTEVNEVAEGFGKQQKGSSAMPHKRNPIGSENISGCARILRGFNVAALENVALWHERDISHSSTERFMLPDATTTLHYMLKRMKNIIQNLVVNKEKMYENIFITHGSIFSQRAMLELISRDKVSREEAYDKIQKLAKDAIMNKLDFGSLLVKANIFSEKEIKNIYDLKYYSKNIKFVYERLGL